MTKELKKNKELQYKICNDSLSLRTSSDKNLKLMQYGICALLMSFCVFPEVFAAATLEQQLDKVSVLTLGKIKTIGISLAVIVALVWAIAKSNLVGIVTSVGLGVIAAFYLEWIDGGMKLSRLVTDHLYLFA